MLLFGGLADDETVYALDGLDKDHPPSPVITFVKRSFFFFNELAL